MSSESRLVIGLIDTSFGEIARRDPVTTTSCNAVSFAAAGAVCAYAGPTADAAAAASTARTAYCSLVFPIIFSHEFENDPSSANTVLRKFIPALPVRFVNGLQHATRWLPSRQAEPRTVNFLTFPSHGGRPTRERTSRQRRAPHFDSSIRRSRPMQAHLAPLQRHTNLVNAEHILVRNLMFLKAM